jgi:8-oxo-dGTP diphosphatase
MTKISHDSKTPALNQQVITACAFIHQNINGVDEVFLAKRAYTKKFLPGVYELPGGHVDFGEDPVHALKREIDEELGMEIIVGDPFFVFTYTNEVKGSHSIEVIYFAKFIGEISDIKMNPEDHSDFGWFSEEGLVNVITEAKRLDDIEFQAIRKGFSLLRGQPLQF